MTLGSAAALFFTVTSLGGLAVLGIACAPRRMH